MSRETSVETRRRRSFTLVEVLVSLAILSVIILVLGNVTTLVSKTYLQTTVKAGQFRAAQAGFESLTRRLSQATLNTYLDYEDVNNANDQAYVITNSVTAFVPTHYGRQSELRFIAGNIYPAGTIDYSGAITSTTALDTNFGTASSPVRPLHSVFFAAPLNLTLLAGNIGLNRLMNVCGYYIEYNSDPNVPSVLSALAPRYRFRLMEMDELAENVSVYRDGATNASYNGHGWFTGPLGPNGTNNVDGDSGSPAMQTPACSYVLADNIVALIVLPRLSYQDEQNYVGATVNSTTMNSTNVSAALAPNYYYDSTTIGYSSDSSGTASGYSSTTLPDGFNLAGGANTKNQLPPVVQVTMVAIDEPSAIRLQNAYPPTGGSPPTPNAMLISKLYRSGGLSTGNLLFTDATLYQSDLIQFKTNLSNLNLTYRVFETTVSVKDARWSSLQTGG